MAIVDTYPVLVHPLGMIANVAATTAITMDAAGESVGLVGRIVWKGGAASDTKVLSSAGGAIYLPINTVTFANAGSTLTVGLQDLNPSHVEDGTFDVSGSLVGVTDTISATRYLRVPMDTGTKTVTFGDTLAMVAELVSKGGSDVVTIDQATTTYLNTILVVVPYGTQDSGSGPVKRTASYGYAIEFDDGTMGWVHGMPPLLGLRGLTTVSVSPGSTPDHYANTFTPSCPMRVTGLWADLQGVAAVDEPALRLFSDPYGTATFERLALLNPAATGGTAGLFVADVDAYDLVAGQTYAVAVSPTTGGAILITYQELQTGNAALKAFSHLEGVQLATSNDTVTWTNGSTTQILRAGLIVSGFDDGTGSGGGGLVTHPGMGGGLSG